MGRHGIWSDRRERADHKGVISVSQEVVEFKADQQAFANARVRILQDLERMVILHRYGRAGHDGGVQSESTAGCLSSLSISRGLSRRKGKSSMIGNNMRIVGGGHGPERGLCGNARVGNRSRDRERIWSEPAIYCGPQVPIGSPACAEAGERAYRSV